MGEEDEHKPNQQKPLENVTSCILWYFILKVYVAYSLLLYGNTNKEEGFRL